jgi:hypothetical protein
MIKYITEIRWNDCDTITDRIVTFSRSKYDATKHALDIYLKNCPNRILKVYAINTKKIKELK